MKQHSFIRMLEQPMRQCPNCKEYIPAEYVVCVWCGYDLTKDIEEELKKKGVKLSWIEAIRRIWRVIRSPFEGMREVSVFPDKRGPKLILYGIAFLLTLQLNVFIWKSKYVVPTRYAVWVGIIFQAVYPFFLLILMVIGMALLSRFIYFLVNVLGGKTEKGAINTLFVYSLSPLLITESFATIFRLFYPSVSFGSITYSSVANAYSNWASSGLTIFVDIVRIIGWVWAAVLFTYGLKRNAKISYVESGLITFIIWGIALSTMFAF